MRYAHVVVDIPTRALEGAFDYSVPDELARDVEVGSTVLVNFSRRPSVGYVVALTERPASGVPASKIRPVLQVLAPSAFDLGAARVASWMAREYACPPCEAIRPFLAPGQLVKIRREDDASPWQLVCEKSGPVDDRWVCLSEDGKRYEPRGNASRQRAVLDALSAGPVRMAELAATINGAAKVVAALERRGAVTVETRRRVRGSGETTLSSAVAPRPQRLTDGQREALSAIGKAREAGRGDVVLVDGVTGSGKTEVYLAAIEQTLEEGKGALVLVPEISLTAQTVGRFRSRFGDDVAVLHSRLSVGERYDQWDLVRQGLAHVVVGARSALFAPLANVGLIIIDEEHEGSYKQGQSPRYHARELACRMARERGCALVLGSATPSIESLARCRAGEWGGVRWTRVSMPERPGSSVLPTVQVVDMTQQFGSGNHSIFSDPLKKALEGVIERREKAVLLLNRRGFATFLMCRECGCVPECPHCSTSLTYHERTSQLVCHSCGQTWPTVAYPNPATQCPNCGSRYMGAFGIGTQRVEDELALILGDRAEIIRMDADTTSEKGGHQRLLERFDAAECAVLVGTQMIAKGLDFPEVTLVGVINADTTLKLPDFRAGERTYDLLEQVAGRAGRGDRPGRVIIQTYWAEHPAIQAVARHDRQMFLMSELAEREDAYYPPYARLANVVATGRDVRAVTMAMDDLAASLRKRLAGEREWEVLGPADCLKSRIKDRVRRHVMVKAPAPANMGVVVGGCVRDLGRRPGVSIAVDIDCHDLM
ncbi:MAG: primosomal protein N' [Atopobiaceae bacterium]|nr:primosomal protein N' [Atopobiaceae bacterium]